MFKLTNIAIVVLLLSIVSRVQGAEEKPKWSDAFESDSEFMKGFETGIFIRTKGGKPEDYGCSEFKEDNADAVTSGIEAIRNAILLAKGNLPDEQIF